MKMNGKKGEEKYSPYLMAHKGYRDVEEIGGV
jgi:hypothetical protein